MWEKCLKCSKETKMKTGKCTLGTGFPNQLLRQELLVLSSAPITRSFWTLSVLFCGTDSCLLDSHTPHWHPCLGKSSSNPHSSMRGSLIRKGHLLPLSSKVKQSKVFLFLPTPSSHVVCKWFVFCLALMCKLRNTFIHLTRPQEHLVYTYWILTMHQRLCHILKSIKTWVCP